MDAKSIAKEFSTILPEDADLTMFTIKDLSLSKLDQLVIMKILLKRKIATELLTTFLPTILLLLITFITIFFEADLFADAISVNLTIMLVMTTIFTSKIEELPPTSDMKMIDIWLIFCLVVPFAEVILRTTIECMTCRCNNCHQELGDGIEKGKGRITPAWVATVAPTKVAKFFLHIPFQTATLQEPITLVEPSKTNLQLKTKMGEALGDVRFKCWKRAMIFVGETLVFLVRFIS